MKSIFQINFPKDKPWIVLGKGPSFSKLWYNVNLNNFYSIGLNHVPAIIDVDYGHRMDYWGIPSYYLTNCKAVIMPYNPHMNYKVTNITLFDLILTDPILEKLDYEDRLFYYRHSKVKDRRCIPRGIGPCLRVKYFSSEAVFHLLLMQGITEIFSLGIDGGTGYAKEFEKFQKPLNNGQDTFDKQIPQIENLMAKYKAKWYKL